MNPTRIDDFLSVAPQIGVADLATLAQAGFRAVMCNRPEGESADQTPFAEIKQAAEALGMKVAYVPAAHSQMGPALAQDFANALKDLPKPVLAYCRSGARSSMLWSMARDFGMMDRVA